MLALRTLLSASAISFLAVSFLLRGSFVDMARTLAKRRWRRQCREVGAQDGHAVAGHGTGRDDVGMRGHVPGGLGGDLRVPLRPLTRVEDRKRVVAGKSVSVRVDLGGRRLIKKKKEQ